MSYDLISIGDPTVDTFLRIHDALVAVDLNTEKQQLIVDFANKIPVDSFFRFPAGNSVNVAVGAARLGFKSAMYGLVGNDPDGQWIIKELQNEGLDTKLVRIDKKQATNSSTVLVFRKERTIFVWHETRDYQLPVFPLSKWVYLTSSGPLSNNLERLHKQVLGYLKSHDTKMAFNPGTYQLLMGKTGLEPLLTRTTVLFLNKEETQDLTGKRSTDIKVLLRALHDLGAEIAVITDGPKGSFSYDGNKYRACGIYDLPVVERTGAGDSYGCAFTCALCSGETIENAMRWGTFNSAYVVGQYGGVLGLVNKHLMSKLTQDHPELRVREI